MDRLFAMQTFVRVVETGSFSAVAKEMQTTQSAVSKQIAALEGAPYGVRVNAVAPGPIQTDMLDRFIGDEAGKAQFLATLPIARAGKPEEIAQTILFVAGDKAPFITGQSITVDGGYLAR